jgi:cholesterol transport system auxiliary component
MKLKDSPRDSAAMAPGNACWRHLATGLVCLGLLITLGGCSSLLPKPVPPPATFELEAAPPAKGSAKAPGTSTRFNTGAANAPSLLVSNPLSAPGHDSHRMAYTRSPYQLEYFARNEWVDTPARMLAPLIVAALQADAAFSAVTAAPSTAASDLQLDTTVLRLQQNFNTTPSTLTFTLRASVTHTKTRRVVAWYEFEENVPTLADTPQAGVVAANRAVQLVLVELAAFCRATAIKLSAAPP